MLTRRTFSAAAVAAALVAALLSAPPAAAKGADEFIRNMGQEAISSLTGPELDDKEREARFRRILNASFDIQTIGRFTLGRYWRVATREQRAEYMRLLEDFVVGSYAARFKEYKKDGSFRVGNVRDINEREKLVSSEILRDGQPPVAVHWRVRADKDFKIVDVVVEGISMGITQRDEFAAVIRNNGGKVESLLSALRKKTARE
ncbi:MAG: ABC transporter substrate-binding protein [Alphaproteobacteria bacterium]|nr:ABC transporter substrate-binding protein [Alphaproteobacteria bacterium]